MEAFKLEYPLPLNGDRWMGICRGRQIGFKKETSNDVVALNADIISTVEGRVGDPMAREEGEQVNISAVHVADDLRDNIKETVIVTEGTIGKVEKMPLQLEGFGVC